MSNIKVEIFDDDRGWVYYCDGCGKRVELEDSKCGFCGYKFDEIRMS